MPNPVEIAWSLERRQQNTLVELRDGWQKAPYRGKIRASLICNNLAKKGLLHTRQVRKATLYCLTVTGCQVQQVIKKGVPAKQRGNGRDPYIPRPEHYAVLDHACEMFGVKRETVYERRRSQIMQDVRHAVTLALYRKWPKITYKAISIILGRPRDHSMSVLWLRTGMERAEKEEWFADVVAELVGEELPEPEPINHERLAAFWHEREASLAEIKALDEAIMAHETRSERAAMKAFSDNLLAAIQSARAMSRAA
jgi:hypothetical protein